MPEAGKARRRRAGSGRAAIVCMISSSISAARGDIPPSAQLIPVSFPPLQRRCYSGVIIYLDSVIRFYQCQRHQR